MNTILIVMHTNHVQFSVSSNGVLIADGSELLSSNNGDYDALLSNVVNLAHVYCPPGEIDFIFRKA